MLVAAMCASSLVASSVGEVVAAGLSVVPAGSRLARAVRDAVADAESEPDFERVVDRLYERHGALHWVHTINNAALVAAALIHGRGDFTASIAGAVAGGWDTDSAGATVGSIAGGLLGASRIPAGWALENRLASSLTRLRRHRLRRAHPSHPGGRRPMTAAGGQPCDTTSCAYAVMPYQRPRHGRLGPQSHD